MLSQTNQTTQNHSNLFCIISPSKWHLILCGALENLTPTLRLKLQEERRSQSPQNFTSHRFEEPIPQTLVAPKKHTVGENPYHTMLANF